MKSESKIPSLHKLQRQFKKEIKNLKTPVANLIASTPSVPVKTRLQVYKDAYFLRIKESLIEDFPMVFKVLGEENFSKMVWKYLETFPSKYWTLAEVGDNFSPFFQKSKAYKPALFFSDLAHLEWLKIKSELMLPQSLDLSAFENLGEHDLTSKVLKKNPSLHYFSSSWNLLKIAKSPKKSLVPHVYGVYQLEGMAKVMELTMGEKKILSKLDKKNLSQLTHELEKTKLSSQEVQRVFSKWVKEGLILGLE